jgi:predicted transcriptional regulator
MIDKEHSAIYEMQAELCRAMSSALRLEIVHLLREAPMQVNELAGATGQPHRVGQGVWYEIANLKISAVCDLMREVLLEEARFRSELLQTMRDEAEE